MLAARRVDARLGRLGRRGELRVASDAGRAGRAPARRARHSDRRRATRRRPRRSALSARSAGGGGAWLGRLVACASAGARHLRGLAEPRGSSARRARRVAIVGTRPRSRARATRSGTARGARRRASRRVRGSRSARSRGSSRRSATSAFSRRLVARRRSQGSSTSMRCFCRSTRPRTPEMHSLVLCAIFGFALARRFSSPRVVRSVLPP